MVASLGHFLREHYCSLATYFKRNVLAESRASRFRRPHSPATGLTKPKVTSPEVKGLAMKIDHSRQLEEFFAEPLSENVFQEILERIVRAKQEAQMHLQQMVLTQRGTATMRGRTTCSCIDGSTFIQHFARKLPIISLRRGLPEFLYQLM
jgi:hypothetical protein